MTKKPIAKKPTAVGAATAANDLQKTALPLTMHNYKLMLIGFVIIVVGFILMGGGRSADPNVFNGEELYSFRRITLATVMVMLGFMFEMYAIMRRSEPVKTSPK